LLHKVTDTFNKFATMMENASGATSMNVPLAGKATASPYYTKKLVFNKYYDKMLKRKKSPKITKCEVLTKKGPITLKIYREDGFDEVILNLKQAAGGPTSLRATSEEEAHLQLSSGHDASADSTVEADPGISAPKDSISYKQDKTKSARDGLRTAHTDSGANEESRADDISLKVKLDD
nr:hypothetical protein [Tanacetum cinerariifolium]